MYPEFDALLFELLDVAQHCRKLIERCGGDIPLTLPACRALLLVATCQGLSQRQLAALADVHPAKLARVLDGLEKRGWIQRVSDPNDRRARRIFLAARAEPLVSRIRTAIRSTTTDALRDVPEEERASMLRNLGQMRRNLAAEAPEMGQSPQGPRK